jgi:hypothetical protein
MQHHQYVAERLKDMQELLSKMEREAMWEAGRRGLRFEEGGEGV